MTLGIIVEARPGGGTMQWEPGHPAGETVGKEGDNSSSAKARGHQAEEADFLVMRVLP